MTGTTFLIEKAIQRKVGGGVHKTYNCIVVFNREKDAALFCKRRNDPYKSLYNFVGGKVEPGEESDKQHIVNCRKRPRV